jgi:hypothetical protein
MLYFVLVLPRYYRSNLRPLLVDFEEALSQRKIWTALLFFVVVGQIAGELEERDVVLESVAGCGYVAYWYEGGGDCGCVVLWLKNFGLSADLLLASGWSGKHVNHGMGSCHGCEF